MIAIHPHLRLDSANNIINFHTDVDIVSISSDTVDQDADPYLGLSMRKDREELVIEVLEKPAEFFVELKDEGSDQCGSKVCAKEITQGEWLRGCPEGAEQSVGSYIIFFSQFAPI